LWVLTSTAADADQVRVAAAASLARALPALAERFEIETGHTLLTSFGSSGNLVRQISEGAPFEVLISANADYVLSLARVGLTLDEGAVYAVGRLVMFVPAQSDVAPSADLSSLEIALNDGRLRRLAIANPAHAPYGVAAREALINAGIWAPIQAKLVWGENATQAAQFTVSGNVEAGLVPYSIAVVPTVAARGRFVLVSEDLYTPLQQRMVLLKGAGAAAASLIVFMRGDAAAAILSRYGLQR
jgi:molybdate transport system substrate-binding protein